MWPASDPEQVEVQDSDSDALSSTLEMGKTDSEHEGPVSGPAVPKDAGSIDGEELSNEEAEEEEQTADPVVHVESPVASPSSESEEEPSEKSEDADGSWWGKAYTAFGPTDRLERTRVPPSVLYQWFLDRKPTYEGHRIKYKGTFTKSDVRRLECVAWHRLLRSELRDQALQVEFAVCCNLVGEAPSLREVHRPLHSALHRPWHQV